MKIAPHQVAGFFDAFFKGREAELRAIGTDARIRQVAAEQRKALEFAGFDNATSPDVATACFKWLCARSPYVMGGKAPS